MGNLLEIFLLTSGEVYGRVSREKVVELVLEANKIPFHEILKLGSPKGAGVQIQCPFPDHHQHGDRNKSARVYYDTNRIWCFTANKLWTPTQFVAEKLRISKFRAATALLRKFRPDRLSSLNSGVDSELRISKKVASEEDLEFYDVLEKLYEEKGIREFIYSQREIHERYGVDLRSYTEKMAADMDEMIKEGQNG